MTDETRVREEFEKWAATVPKCLGYPKCDGDLVGLEHSDECPVKTPGRVTEFTWFDVWKAALASAAEREKELREALENIKSWKYDQLTPAGDESPVNEAFKRGVRMAFYRCADEAERILSKE